MVGRRRRGRRLAAMGRRARRGGGRHLVDVRRLVRPRERRRRDAGAAGQRGVLGWHRRRRARRPARAARRPGGRVRPPAVQHVPRHAGPSGDDAHRGRLRGTRRQVVPPDRPLAGGHRRPGRAAGRLGVPALADAHPGDRGHAGRDRAAPAHGQGRLRGGDPGLLGGRDQPHRAGGHRVRAPRGDRQRAVRRRLRGERSAGGEGGEPPLAAVHRRGDGSVRLVDRLPELHRPGARRLGGGVLRSEPGPAAAGEARLRPGQPLPLRPERRPGLTRHRRVAGLAGRWVSNPGPGVDVTGPGWLGPLHAVDGHLAQWLTMVSFLSIRCPSMGFAVSVGVSAGVSGCLAPAGSPAAGGPAGRGRRRGPRAGGSPCSGYLR
ncbi:hypothetical protein FRACA_70003 [Frankia canadensis]|uniref:Uncharacterized protein n=1 Tax=Frankia canadensis TaxID=1836972 RepID=A0A2I2L0I4_9ACTN|nr:hypothetical protein FRACA_70003 [Frankia canadensis]SOU58677.1 hypothetical protein FRACA_70003 [Frankia canadensis]